MKSAINYSLTKEMRRGKKGRRKACEEGYLIQIRETEWEWGPCGGATAGC